MSVLTPTGTASFPNLFKPRSIGDSDPKFSLTIMFDPDNPGLADLKKAAEDCAKAKWPNELPKKLKTPFIDGDDLDRPEAAGKVVLRLNANADRPPKVYNASKGIITEENASEFYAGCQCRAVVRPYAWSYMGGHGVSFGLVDVQKVGEGEHLAGGLRGDSLFDAVEAEKKEEATGSDLF